MRIGLITVHCSVNPGACLQTHALYKKLEELGYEPFVINYRPAVFTDFMDEKKKKSSLKGRIKHILLGQRLKDKHDKYTDFEQRFYPDKTERFDTQEELNRCTPPMDACLCGSDQIWNPIHIRYDASFFGAFAADKGAAVASYASSIGQDSLAEKDTAFLKEQIKKLKQVSVREDIAVSLIKQFGLTAQQHVDPTLLYDGDYWRGVAEPVRKCLPDKYILYYPLQRNPFELDLIKALKTETGLPCVAAEDSLFKTKGADVQATSCSPTEFIWLIDHAEYVVTNSFHGCVFSILLHKKLIPFKNQERNSRIDSLCRLLHLEDIQTDSLGDFFHKDWPDYWSRFRDAEVILTAERIRADEYLKGCFHDGS